MVGVALVASVVVAVAACDDESDGMMYSGRGSAVRCGDYKTCGTCTPVLGCGWCATGNGTGTCTDGPDNCSSAPQGWNWDPSGCTGDEAGTGHSIAEAGLGAPDASTTLDATPAADGSADALTDAASD